MESSPLPAELSRQQTAPLLAEAPSCSVTHDKKNPPLRQPVPPPASDEHEAPLYLDASVLPDGFPPQLAYRALAAYALLRTLSRQLRLSPFTPNVFLRALALPYPNRLLGQIHVNLLRILFPNLHLGYSYRQNGGLVASKRVRIEENDGVRHSTIHLRAGDNLTYLDGLSWPMFYEDYVHLTADALWTKMNGTELNVDFRNIALRLPSSLETFEESDEEEPIQIEPTEELTKHSRSGGQHTGGVVAADRTAARVSRKQSGRGRGLPTRQNRILKSTLSAKQDSSNLGSIALSGSDSDSDSESDYEEDDEYRTMSGRRSKRKRKNTRASKSQKKREKISTPVKANNARVAQMSSPGSRVLEVSIAQGPGTTVRLPLSAVDPASQLERNQPSLNTTVSSSLPLMPGTGTEGPMPRQNTPSSGLQTVSPHGSTGTRPNIVAGPVLPIAPTLATPSLAYQEMSGTHSFQSSSVNPFSASNAAHDAVYGTLNASGVVPIANTNGSLGTYCASHEQRDMLPNRGQQPTVFQKYRNQKPTVQGFPVHAAQSNQMFWAEQTPGFPGLSGIQRKGVLGAPHSMSFRNISNRSVPKTNSHEVSHDVADQIQNFITRKSIHPPALHSSTQVQQGVLRYEEAENNGEAANASEKAKLDSHPTEVDQERNPPNPHGPLSSSVSVDKTSAKDESLASRGLALDSNTSPSRAQVPSRPETMNQKVDDTESIATADSLFDRSDPETWPQFKPVERMRRGIPYHRLPVEQKLHILEFLLDELLTVDFIAAEFTSRNCSTGCYGLPYGPLPTESELDAMENDDECVICGREGELLCCDGCTASYHRRCVNVAIGSDIPEGAWLCADCKVVDPSQLGPLRGGKKCALDWFTLNDIEEAHQQKAMPDRPNRYPHVAESADQSTTTAVHDETGTDAGLVTSDTTLLAAVSHTETGAFESATPSGAENSSNANGEMLSENHSDAPQRMKGDGHRIGDENSGTLGSEKRFVDGCTRTPTTPLPHAWREKGLDQMEFLVVHGFVFQRRRSSDKEAGSGYGVHDTVDSPLPAPIAKSREETKAVQPLTQTELRRLLSKLGSRLNLSWPLVQIPSSGGYSPKLRPRPKSSCEAYFSQVESYDPSMYLSRYRMAPLPCSKKNRCVGSQLTHLVHSEYETECARSATQRTSSVMSRNFSSDGSLAKQLRVGTDLYNPYTLFADYMVKLELNLRSACLLDESWGTRNRDCRSDIWEVNVRRCRSVRRLARLLVSLVDAANSRVFLIDWHRPPNHIPGKSDADSDSRTYLSLPADWTPEGELRKRKLERSSYSHFRSLFVSESPHFDGFVAGTKVDAKASASGSRKRKRSMFPVKSVILAPENPESKKKVEQLAYKLSPNAQTIQRDSCGVGIDSPPAYTPVASAQKQGGDVTTIKVTSARESETGSEAPPCKAAKSGSTPTIVTSAPKPFNNDSGIRGNGMQPSMNGTSATLSDTSTKPGSPGGVSCAVGASCQLVPAGFLRPSTSPPQRGNNDVSEPSSNLQEQRSDADTCSLTMKASDLAVGGRIEKDRVLGEPETEEVVVTHDNSANGGEPRIQQNPSTKKRVDNPVQEPRRSRRSGRLKSRGEVHDSIGSLVNRSNLRSSDNRYPVGITRGVLANEGMEALIAEQRTSKIRMLEELMRSPFEKEIHWPLAGRTLFEPMGSLPPSEMKRMGRNAGTVVAPFLTYNALFEVGQAAVCHIWRKQTLQCDSFEKLVMQIRILDSFINKSTTSACDSLSRRAASTKSQVQKVIRCTQRDLPTGVTHYFVVNRGKFRGCWVSEHNIDLSALILERSKRRDILLRKIQARLKLKSKKESARVSKANSQQKPVTYKKASGPGDAANSHASSSAPPRSGEYSRGESWKTTKKPEGCHNPNSQSDGGVMATINAIALQHQIETGGLLMECAKFRLSSVPVSKMNNVRAKHMQLLKKAIGPLSKNGIPFVSHAQLVDHLMKAEEAASIQYQSSAANLQMQRSLENASGTGNLHAASASNGGHSIGSGTGSHGGLPFATVVHQQGHHTTAVGSDFLKSLKMHPTQQQEVAPRHANYSANLQLAAVAAMQSIPPRDPIAFSMGNVQIGQRGYFQSNYGRTPAQVDYWGNNANSGGQQRNALLPSGVESLARSFGANFADIGQTPAQLNQLMNHVTRTPASLIGTTSASSYGAEANLYGRPNDIGPGSTFQPSPFDFGSTQQRHVVDSTEKHSTGSAPWSETRRVAYMDTTDFEPRPLEDMANDMYKGYK